MERPLLAFTAPSRPVTPLASFTDSRLPDHERLSVQVAGLSDLRPEIPALYRIDQSLRNFSETTPSFIKGKLTRAVNQRQ